MEYVFKDGSLIDKLRELNSKLQIKLGFGGEDIEASFWSYDGHYEISVTFPHDKGEICMGYPFTLNRDEYDESDPYFHDMKEAFDSEKEFEEWLDAIADYQNKILTFARPGIEIFSILNDKEKKDIGMEIELQENSMDSCESVKVRDVEKLKKLLLKYNLPFYFGDNIHPQLRDIVVLLCEYFNVPSSEKRIKEFADKLKVPNVPTLKETYKKFTDGRASSDKMPTTEEFMRVYWEIRKN